MGSAVLVDGLAAGTSSITADGGIGLTGGMGSSSVAGGISSTA